MVQNSTEVANPLMPKEEDMVRLPAIDMTDTEENIVAQIYEQMTTLGFLQLKNIDGFNEQELLLDIKEFHSMPDSEKKKLQMKQFNQDNPNMYHGLTPFIDNDVSHKEFFDMGSPYEDADEEERKQYLVEDTPLPTHPDFSHLAVKYRQHEIFARQLGLKLAEYIAIGLGKDRYFFQDWFTGHPLATFRTIKYLPRIQSTVRSDKLDEQAKRLTTPPHCDSGFITILATFGYPGLQVLYNGEYRYVKPLPNHLVVNLGKTLERITNFTLKATSHQVADIGVERYSCPFFLDPCSSAVIHSNILNSAEDQVEPPIEYGKWLAKNMKRSYGEWKDAFPELVLTDDEDEATANQSATALSI